MSRPRYYWFGIVKTIIYQYPERINRSTPKGEEAYRCIRTALAKTENSEDGAERLKLIEMVFFKRTHKVFGAAREIHISESTAKRWISDFVYIVAREMGYL